MLELCMLPNIAARLWLRVGTLACGSLMIQKNWPDRDNAVNNLKGKRTQVTL